MSIDSQNEVKDILTQTYEQGVYEADESAYENMDEAHKGSRMTTSQAKQAIQALIQRERQAARQNTIEQLHQIYNRGDVTIEQALAELEEAA